MDFILNLVPWWAYLILAAVAGLFALRWFGFTGLITALMVGAAIASYAKGRKAGVTVERAKQTQADTKARDVIHEKKEDVRSIPQTPAGKAEKRERLDRWVK